MGEELAGGQMNLETPSIDFKPEFDARPKLPEPPPVRLVAVNDVRLPAAAGIEPELDEFYVGLLQFVREPESMFPIYLAENFRLVFDVIEPPIVRQDLRPVQIDVPSLAELEAKFVEAEVEYTRTRGLTPGEQSLVLLDPAGNWVEVGESREIR
jgi:hypothetical protein